MVTAIHQMDRNNPTELSPSISTCPDRWFFSIPTQLSGNRLARRGLVSKSFPEGLRQHQSADSKPSYQEIHRRGFEPVSRKAQISLCDWLPEGR